MTRICLLGEAETNLRYELLSRETSRRALAAYELAEPFANSIAVESVSLGAAVALLNDLDWHLARFVTDSFVLEPSVSDSEWLSRGVATAIRADELDPDDSGRFLKIYGVQYDEDGGADADTDTDAPEADELTDGPPRLVEPMFLARSGDDESVPEYDIRPVEETLRVRVTEAEFSP